MVAQRTFRVCRRWLVVRFDHEERFMCLIFKNQIKENRTVFCIAYAKAIAIFWPYLFQMVKFKLDTGPAMENDISRLIQKALSAIDIFLTSFKLLSENLMQRTVILCHLFLSLCLYQRFTDADLRKLTVISNGLISRKLTFLFLLDRHLKELS